MATNLVISGCITVLILRHGVGRVLSPKWCQVCPFDKPRVLHKFCKKIVVIFQNSPKNLDPSCKMDLDFWNCFGIEIL